MRTTLDKIKRGKLRSISRNDIIRIITHIERLENEIKRLAKIKMEPIIIDIVDY